jgi:hypothetical protein
MSRTYNYCLQIMGWNTIGKYDTKGYICKLGLTNNPICERCLEKEKSATHILHDWRPMPYLRFRHLGHFMGPDDYHDVRIRKVLFFIRSVGLIEGLIIKESTIDLGGRNARARLIWPIPYIYSCIHKRRDWSDMIRYLIESQLRIISQKF